MFLFDGSDVFAIWIYESEDLEAFFEELEQISKAKRAYEQASLSKPTL